MVLMMLLIMMALSLSWRWKRFWCCWLWWLCHDCWWCSSCVFKPCLKTPCQVYSRSTCIVVSLVQSYYLYSRLTCTPLKSPSVTTVGHWGRPFTVRLTFSMTKTQMFRFFFTQNSLMLHWSFWEEEVKELRLCLLLRKLDAHNQNTTSPGYFRVTRAHWANRASASVEWHIPQPITVSVREPRCTLWCCYTSTYIMLFTALLSGPSLHHPLLCMLVYIYTGTLTP